MKKPDYEKIVALMETYWPNRKFDTKLRRAWWLALEPFKYDEVRDAIVKYARANKFFPDVADITGNLRDNSWMDKYMT